MKFCKLCEIEIYTLDGVNTCQDCRKKKTEKQKAARKANAAARREAMKSLGLVRVKGAMGGVYWE